MEIKTTVTEMNAAWDKLIGRLNKAEGKNISQFGDMTIESSQTEKQ